MKKVLYRRMLARRGLTEYRPAIRMRLNRSGELVYNQCRLRSDFVGDVTEAVKRLRSGEVIWLQQYGPLVTAVQRALGS